MVKRCLLISTKGENKKFLTYEKNLSALIEFAKTFSVEIYLAKPESGQKIMELKALTAAICDPLYQAELHCVKLERIFPRTNKNRKSILADANKIRSYITSQFLAGKLVSLKDLKERFKKQKVTDACLCSHLTSVRKSLSQNGHEFRKVSAGTYCLSDAE